MFLKILLLLCSKYFYKLILIPNTFGYDKVTPNLVIINKNSKKYNGYDHRFSFQTPKNNTEIYNIINYYNNKKKLDILMSKNVCMYKKIELIRENTITPYSLFSGGLMDQFNFEDF